VLSGGQSALIFDVELVKAKFDKTTSLREI